jgi:hypothetical protein
MALKNIHRIQIEDTSSPTLFPDPICKSASLSHCRHSSAGLILLYSSTTIANVMIRSPLIAVREAELPTVGGVKNVGALGAGEDQVPKVGAAPDVPAVPEETAVPDAVEHSEVATETGTLGLSHRLAQGLYGIIQNVDWWSYVAVPMVRTMVQGQSVMVSVVAVVTVYV